MNNWAKTGKVFVTLNYFAAMIAAAVQLVIGALLVAVDATSGLMTMVMGVLYGLYAWTLVQLVDYVNKVKKEQQ